jgi:hypothetical protein
MDENNQILECDFAFKCPQQWDKLTRLDDPDKRFCESGDREVSFVRTRQQLAVYQKQGHCIAADVDLPEFGGVVKGITIGGILEKIGTYRQDTTTLYLFGEQDDVDDLMVVLDQVQRNKG